MLIARRHPRLPLHIKFSLTYEAAEITGSTEDFSVDGLKLITTIPVPEGTPLVLRCSFGEVCYLNLVGQIMFRRPLENGDNGTTPQLRPHIIGIKLATLKPWEEHILRSVIEEVRQSASMKDNSLLKISVSRDTVAMEAATLIHAKPRVRRHGFGRADFIPKQHKPEYSLEAVTRRREWLQDRTGVSLNHISHFSEPLENLRGTIENLIGTAQLPLGIAGPLTINGDHARGIFYVPMATTEGALTYTCNQGMLLISLAGGAKTSILKEEIHIAPSFSFPTMTEAKEFVQWLEAHFDEIKACTDSTTKHGQLTRIEPHLLDRNVVVKFCYRTGDAMGLNIITFATEAACKYILSVIQPLKFYLQPSFSGVKKVTSHNFVMGYGKTVVSEVTIPGSLIKRVYGIAPSAIVDFYHMVSLATSHAGMVGISGHTANALAAVFIACGQDAASVVDSYVAITNFELTKDNSLYASVKLPSVLVGTVGGGTHLATQRECLSLLGCNGSDNANKFAEIVTATVLAGEIGICARVANGTFANAHRKYGRSTSNNGSTIKSVPLRK